jgi:hypothetical protein
MPWQVIEWTRHYESSRTQTIALRKWAQIPNKQHGLSYSKLIALPDGEAIYGAFVALIAMLSRQVPHRDGWLTEDGSPDGVALSCSDVALVTKCRVEIVESMLAATCRSDIAWLMWRGGDPDPLCADDATSKQDRVRIVKTPESTENESQQCRDIYAAYPKKVGRKAALRSISKALRDCKDPAMLIERVQQYAAAVRKWTVEDRKKYIPNPTTWFSQERWADDQSTWKRSTEFANNRERTTQRKKIDKRMMDDYRAEILSSNEAMWSLTIMKARENVGQQGAAMLQEYMTHVRGLRDKEERERMDDD